MKKEYIEKIYAGWMAKVIGIRLGAPIEGWTYQKIKEEIGEITGYVRDYKTFAADDDSNGPLFFLRGLESAKNKKEMKAQHVGEALLNFAPFEHGFFWWGGYGISTEHTAYLNLRSGIPAPRSGSIAQNGATVAEQIGGQIFIDTWGLVCPGNPELAAKLAKEAASVTHGGNGVYGGIFIAVCISLSFDESNIETVIQKALTFIPEDCEYARIVRAVVDFYHKHPESWEACFSYIYDNFGYDKYPGNCHIIPNIAVMILGLMYGQGDFAKSILICNMCGWDTDCNVGNIATILGVLGGLEGIDYDKWRQPINDLLICSSVVGSLNIMDVPYGATYIGKLAWELSGEKVPEFWDSIYEKRINSCHFEYPGSTHVFRIRGESSSNAESLPGALLLNTDEEAFSGNRSLKVQSPAAGKNLYIYKKTYYVADDFDDSRYDPCFSPTVYPGQTLHGSILIPKNAQAVEVSLFARDQRSQKEYMSEKVKLEPGKWSTLSFSIPSLAGALIHETGYCVHSNGDAEFTGYIDDFYSDGNPSYTIELNREETESWSGLHREVSQFTRLKGLMYLADGELHLSGADFAEGYTGSYDWKDYMAIFHVTPLTGENSFVNVRVQGAIRSYAVGFMEDQKVGLLKNTNGYKELQTKSFAWKSDKEYIVKVRVEKNRIQAEIDGEILFDYTDEQDPYLEGSLGVSIRKGSHMKCRKIEVSSV